MNSSLALPLCFLCFAFTNVFGDEKKPHIVMLIAEHEYRTDETLPAFAEKYLNGKYRTSIVHADNLDPNMLVGIEKVKEADLLVVSVRRRTLPKDQLDLIRKYVADGKPVIGIRTANHAFCLRGSDPPEGRDQWLEFDQEVFGGNYTNHYGADLKTTYTITSKDEAAAGLLLNLSRDKTFESSGSLYKVAPVADSAVVLVWGSVPNQPAEPIVWTFRRAEGGKSFYTSLGHVDDFKGEVLPQLLQNAIAWALQ